MNEMNEWMKWIIKDISTSGDPWVFHARWRPVACHRPARIRCLRWDQSPGKWRFLPAKLWLFPAKRWLFPAKSANWTMKTLDLSSKLSCEFQHHNVGLSSKKKTMALNHQTDGFKRWEMEVACPAIMGDLTHENGNRVPSKTGILMA